jgi:hypothetical protein
METRTLRLVEQCLKQLPTTYPRDYLNGDANALNNRQLIRMYWTKLNHPSIIIIRRHEIKGF